MLSPAAVMEKVSHPSTGDELGPDLFGATVSFAEHIRQQQQQQQM